MFIYQTKYAKEILKKFRTDECKSLATIMCQKEKPSKMDEAERVDESLYRSLAGYLIYLTATRLDILHVVSLLSRFTNYATETYFTTANRVLKYVKETLDLGVKFCASPNCVLQGSLIVTMLVLLMI